MPGAAAEVVAVAGGSFAYEVSWALSCTDGATALGGPPYTGSITVAAGTTCTLTMTDSYGDGWNGFVWSGFGQSITLTSGSSGTETFVMPPRPPPSPPSPP
eukprot:3450628-Prymnesium_polylepis.1